MTPCLPKFRFRKEVSRPMHPSTPPPWASTKPNPVLGMLPSADELTVARAQYQVLQRGWESTGFHTITSHSNAQFYERMLLAALTKSIMEDGVWHNAAKNEVVTTSIEIPVEGCRFVERTIAKFIADTLAAGYTVRVRRKPSKAKNPATAKYEIFWQVL